MNDLWDYKQCIVLRLICNTNIFTYVPGVGNTDTFKEILSIIKISPLSKKVITRALYVEESFWESTS